MYQLSYLNYLIPILQTQKLSHNKIKPLVQGYTTSKCQSKTGREPDDFSEEYKIFR